LILSFDFPFPFNLSPFPCFSSPFWVVEHWKSGPDKRGACLSMCGISTQEHISAHRVAIGQHIGAAFLWFRFFYPYKRNELAHEGRNHQEYPCTSIKKKKTCRAPAQEQKEHQPQARENTGYL